MIYGKFPKIMTQKTHGSSTDEAEYLLVGVAVLVRRVVRDVDPVLAVAPLVFMERPIPV